MRKPLVLAAAVLGALAVVGIGIAGSDRNTSVHLTGALEIPVRESAGQGQAIFRVARDGTSIDYRLNVSNIDNVFMAHIHAAATADPRSNGGIVVWLSSSNGTTTAVQNPATLPKGTGPQDGVLATGTITAADLTGALAGKSIADLLALFESGRAYVNVHTDDGIAPTNTGAGDFPGGEIRADIG